LRANLSEKEREELIPGGMCVDVVLKPKFRNQAGLQAIRELVTRFEKHERIVDVLSGGEEVQLAFAVVGAIRMFGIIISVLILTGAVFFVFSTIRLSVHARKEEILIRQLMGATRNFIRIPFYLEGMAVGALGAFLAIGIVAVLTERMNSYIRYTQGLPYKVPFLSSSLIFGFVCAGILLGLLGSMFALGRYLKDPS
jgi:cell division transport system permease protein